MNENSSVYWRESFQDCIFRKFPVDKITWNIRDEFGANVQYKTYLTAFCSTPYSIVGFVSDASPKITYIYFYI